MYDSWTNRACMCAQVSDAEDRKLLGQEFQRTRTLEEAVMIFQAVVRTENDRAK